jgi:hypothetical protein
MKTVVSFLFIIFSVCLLSAQTNLVTNPNFSDYASGDSKARHAINWQIEPLPIPIDYNGICGQGTNLDGAATSLSVAGGVINNYDAFQNITNITTGHRYLIKIYYYVSKRNSKYQAAGLYSNWCNINKYGNNFDLTKTPLNYSKLTLSDSLYLKNSFITIDLDMGKWQSYSCEVTAPSGYNAFNFRLRTYSGAIVDWTWMYFVDQTPADVFNPSISETLKASVFDKKLKIFNAQINNIELYNMLGDKIDIRRISDDFYDVSNLSQGIYVVKSGNLTTKIRI